MDRVNEFEYGEDETTSNSWNRDHTNFKVESNINYRYSSAKDLLDNLTVIAAMIQDHHGNQVPRLEVLDDYYKARNTNIKKNKRRRDEQKADHRPAHNYAKIGCQFDVGYNTGIPIKVELAGSEEEYNEQALESLNEFNNFNDVDGLNSELWLDMDKYGRAYEMQYRTKEDKDRVLISNVFETFVIYDTSIERNPIMAVRYPKTRFSKDKQQELVQPIIYTEDKIITYAETTISAIQLKNGKEETHDRKMVPIIEAQPNRYRQGLYEDVLPLIDLYDSAQADTANYMTDFNDALLVVSGDLEESGMDNGGATEMIKSNVLVLKPSTDAMGNQKPITAEYLTKQYDVSGTEAYKKRLVTDIHKIMNIPDLSDENFSGVQSGEAMKYKLFGFEQMTSTKQRMFDKFLRQRYKMFFNLKSGLNESGKIDEKDLVIQFTPNLPVAIKEILETLINAGTEFSQKTLLGLAPFIESAKDEIDRIEEERKNPDRPDFEKVLEETTRQEE